MTPDTLCIFVGGLGANQFLLTASAWPGPSAFDAVHQACPDTLCTSLQDVGYMIGRVPDVADHIIEMKRAYPSIARVVVVDHSMGWEAGRRAAEEGVVDCLIALDAVGLPGVNHTFWPRLGGVRQPGILAKATKQPPTPFIAQLDVSDGPAITEFPDCNHNDVPHHPDMIAAIVKACAPSNSTEMP